VGDRVSWDGSLDAAGGGNAMSTVMIRAQVPDTPIQGFQAQVAGSAVTWWQSTILSDADLSGDNETLNLTDDPNQPGGVDPTPVALGGAATADIPALSELGLLLMALLLAAAALRFLR
jgi:hypothetical protein